ncbi:dCTP deaminase/dUTPase family protein [Secundilactobacillus malefermentans]|uniref:dUTP diphosphatase n=1 Tax=Secundilactobacillus malefermentans TaxID=176292 RepID=A0A4R5NPE0_9LACO|nr:dUTP diphosphatase [Secundilactobacillus malefermentans]KRM58395.1 Deoxyuridine 5-triphosphate nucleotidohydrolase [Secundilactobacillus malefermentans DSM 5705 = KCTC 3548]QEA31994.1 dUTP diphosphatase [Secundilactobacillus malefermentans]TDG77820.1 hypothetical protein C5L31_000214 [Secundilactobacillus malefermentans]
MTRGFKVVKAYQGKDVKIPSRATKNAAGYDFESAADFTLPSIWKMDFIKILRTIRKEQPFSDGDAEKAKKILKPFLIPTGIKAYMAPNEVLILANRSSGPLKHGTILPNGIGVIDADYYDNESNEGEIFIQLINFGLFDRHIKKGERIGQGIFLNYLVADDEVSASSVRTGGFGSSDK